MGKRSEFEREPRDLYPTPYKPMIPLFPFLKVHTGFAGYRPVRYVEPCAAAGQMVAHLSSQGHECVYASDIEPGARWVKKRDALDGKPFPPCDFIITNSPWERKLLHAMIERFRDHAPTWLLYDSDWLFTKQSIPYMEYVHQIIPIGRVKWIVNSRSSGKDNCMWVLFKKERNDGHSRFYRRTLE